MTRAPTATSASWAAVMDPPCVKVSSISRTRRHLQFGRRREADALTILDPVQRYVEVPERLDSADDSTRGVSIRGSNRRDRFGLAAEALRVVAEEFAQERRQLERVLPTALPASVVLVVPEAMMKLLAVHGH